MLAKSGSLHMLGVPVVNGEEQGLKRQWVQTEEPGWVLAGPDRTLDGC